MPLRKSGSFVRNNLPKIGTALLAVIILGSFLFWVKGRTINKAETLRAEQAPTESFTPQPLSVMPTATAQDSPSPTPSPESDIVQKMIARLQGAPYYLTAVRGFRNQAWEQTYVIILRGRKTLDECADQTIVTAARKARYMIGGNDGKSYAEKYRDDLKALTVAEPDCYTGWDWFAEVSFMLGRKEDFQRAVGQMIQLGLHECVKHETWVMMQKALRRGWLTPIDANIRRDEVAGFVGYVEIGSITNDSSPNYFAFEDYTSRKTESEDCLTILASPNYLYMGSAEASRFQGYGVEETIDGTIYRGEFRDGKPNGIGILTQADGTIYSGKFQDGSWANHGIVKDKDGLVIAVSTEIPNLARFGNKLFRGDVENNDFKSGSIYYVDTKASEQGQFNHMQLNGYGVKEWANGLRILGRFEAGEPTDQTILMSKGKTKYYFLGRENGVLTYRSESGKEATYK